MGKAQQVAPNIWWVGCGSWGGYNEVISAENAGNVFLIGKDGDFAMIDTGMANGVDIVLENCAEVGAKAEQITKIIITHAHGDHVEGVPQMKDKTGATVYASAPCAEALAQTTGRWGLGFQVDLIVEEGQDIFLGGYSFKVMLTPGHTRCGVTCCGDVEGKKVLFSGDTAAGDQPPMKGVVGWVTKECGSNPKHLLKNIKRMLGCNADMLLGGHGRPIVGADKVKTSLEHCIQRVEQLLAIPYLNSMMPLDLSD